MPNDLIAIPEGRPLVAVYSRPEEAARQKREQNKRVRAAAHKRIVHALAPMVADMATAEQLADALMAGEIPCMEFRP